MNDRTAIEIVLGLAQAHIDEDGAEAFEPRIPEAIEHVRSMLAMMANGI